MISRIASSTSAKELAAGACGHPMSTRGLLVKKQLTKNPIGTVKSVEIKPARVAIDIDEGRRILTTSPDEVDAFITIETKGRTGEDIISTGNEVLNVGDRFNIVTKWFLGDAVILGMNVAGEK